MDERETERRSKIFGKSTIDVTADRRSHSVAAY